MRKQRIPLFVLLFALLALGAPGSSLAHNGGAFVPRLDPSHPAPTVDGQCQVSEYAAAWRLSSIHYRPSIDLQPATIYLLSTNGDVYLCIDPLVLGTATSAVSVAFDTNHDAGRIPDNDDVLFRFAQDGSRVAKRGDGRGGFVNDPALTGWAAAQQPAGDFQWRAEYRIPLSLIGGGAAWSVVGIHVSHTDILSSSSDFFWPRDSATETPYTWGDLLWLPAPAATTVRIDELRITQGLEFDVLAGVAYDLVAGRRTLVRSQLYASGPIREITGATCFAQRISPTLGPLESISATLPGPIRVNPGPFGFFNGSPTLDCWFEAALLAESGTYRLSTRVTLDDGNTHSIRFGTAEFRESPQLRFFFYPWEDKRSTATRPRAWGSDLTTNLLNSISEFQRTRPLAEGVSPMDYSAVVNDDRLRFFLHPTVDNCPPDGGTCDYLRARANDAFHHYNAYAVRAWILTGIAREFLDWGSLLEATTATGGGQDCWGAQRVAGSGFDADPNGAAAFVVAQEIDHCMGLIRPASPHWDGGWHAVNKIIPTTGGRLLVNMFDQSDYNNPLAAMYGFFDSGHQQARVLMQGWDWNDFRQTMPRPRPAGIPDRQMAEPLFHVVGTIDTSDQVTIIYSKRVNDLPLSLTDPAPNSDYQVVLLDADNDVIGSLRFEPTFDATHGGNEAYAFVLTLPLSSPATRMEIRKGNGILLGQNFSVQPPLVTDVMASNFGQGGVDLAWSASDADSTNLTFNVDVQLGDDSVRQRVATGLTATSTFIRTDTMPGSDEAVFIVEASDGYQVAEAASNPVSIEDKAPGALIRAPQEGAWLVAGQPVRLLGVAYDVTSGALTGEALVWRDSEGALLGTGEALTVEFDAGNHSLTLEAKAPSGLSGTATVNFVVLADGDGDGMANQDEAAHDCLSPAQFDADADPDGDMLTSARELQQGTDPCQADSDSDGMGDGDEVRLGGDPLDGQNLPAPYQFYLSSEALDFNECTGTASQKVELWAASSNVNWSVATDVSWLSASGDGLGDGAITVEVACQGMASGRHTGRVLVSAPGGQLRIIDVGVVQGNVLFLPVARGN